jgi:hypothetical protein
MMTYSKSSGGIYVPNSTNRNVITFGAVSFWAENGMVCMVAEDNGKGLPRQFKPGLGSQLLDEIAFPWSLEKSANGGAILRARIPVSGKKSMQLS